MCTLLGRSTEAFENSLEGAFTFLNTMQDGYVAGSTVRLTQSYSDQLFVNPAYVAFTYDNAVVIEAYLARGTASDIQRAVILGNGLVHAQANNFPVADGRFAQGYYVNAPDASGAYVTPAAYPFYFYSSSVGDQAWAGMALAQLYHATHTAKFPNSCSNVANWIVANTYNTLGAGGYQFRNDHQSRRISLCLPQTANRPSTTSILMRSSRCSPP